MGYIALIEITTFYHAMGIELKRYRAARSKARGEPVFCLWTFVFLICLNSYRIYIWVLSIFLFLVQRGASFEFL